MFETTLTPAAIDPAADGDALRFPAWPEIVARLAAARDLRIALGKARNEASGSFARFAQSQAAAGNEEVNDTTQSVNPNGLAHGKTVRGMVVSAADDAVDTDRETR
mgnify:CR=1 FL=1